jgi:hypothetical protein
MFSPNRIEKLPAVAEIGHCQNSLFFGLLMPKEAKTSLSAGSTLG